VGLWCRLVKLTQACKKLATLSADQRDIAIQSFNKKIVSGGMKSPLAYLNTLVEKGLKNSLGATNAEQPIQTPANDVNARLEVIRLFVSMKKPDFLKEFNKNRAVYIKNVGVIYTEELKAAGLFD
jgi:hypothetical protein